MLAMFGNPAELAILLGIGALLLSTAPVAIAGIAFYFLVVRPRRQNAVIDLPVLPRTREDVID